MKYDGAWLNGMYNNRALVPDHGRYLQSWAERSASARRERCELDLRYGMAPAETLDVFPAARPGAPVLVFIHGGYWRALDKRDHSFIGSTFAAKGACVVVPNYTLCPNISVAGIVQEIAHAIAWTWRNIGRHGGDASRIVVVGHSAGGHLAAMMAATRWKKIAGELPGNLLHAALSISGLHDLEPLMHTPFLQPDLRLTPDEVMRASPCRLPPPEFGTLIAVAGGDESVEYHRQCKLIQDAWGAEHVPTAEVLEGLNHFSIVDAFVDPGHRLHTMTLELLRG